MINYTFKIDLNDGNGLEEISENNENLGYYITKPFIGFSDKTNLNEELDNGFLELISELEEIPVWSYIEYTFDNNKRCFYVGKDSSERLNKLKKIYLHKLELIEVTKKLEKYPIETICFTQSQDKSIINYTLWDVLHRIFRIYEIQEDNLNVEWFGEKYDELPNVNVNKILSSIDEELKEYLNSIEAPTFVMNNLTLREAFDECFKYVDAICKVEDRYKLTCDFFNKLRKLIDIKNKKESYITSSNVEDYATEIQSFLENQITESNDDLYSVVYPNNLLYARLKTREENYQVSESNIGVLLNYPIYDIEDLKVNINYYLLSTEGVELAFIGQDISLKDYIVENSIYEKLKYKSANNLTNVPITDLYSTNTISYKFKDNFIPFSNTVKGFIFEYPSIYFTIVFSLVKHIFEIKKSSILANREIAVSFYDKENYDEGNVNYFARFMFDYTDENDLSTYFLRTLPFVGVDITFSDLFNYGKVRVYYKTILSTRLSVNKNNISDTKIKTSLLMNQNNRIVSLQNISNNMKSTVERIGNYEYSITIRHKNVNEMFEKGDFIKDEENNDIYVCIICETIYYNDFILCKYQFTKNYTRLNEFIGINSQIRQWQIPSGNETYERFIKKDSYCFLTTDMHKDFLVSDENNYDGYTNKYSRRKFFDFFSEEKNSINNAFFNCGDNASVQNQLGESDVEFIWNDLVEGSNTLALECINEGTKDSLIFNFGFNDNISSGYIIQDDDTGLKSLMLKVPYTNTIENKRNGFLRYCSFKLGADNTLFNVKNLPLSEIDFEREKSKGNILFEIPNQLILKDPAEILKFCFQLNFINKAQNKLILGNSFGKYNPLIFGKQKDFYLYIHYKSDTEFDKKNIFKVQGTLFGKIFSEDVNIREFSSTNKKPMVKFTFQNDFWENIEYNQSIYGEIDWLSIGTKDSEGKDLLFAFKYDNERTGIFAQFSNKREDLIEKY